jgi:Hemagglutinin repeat
MITVATGYEAGKILSGGTVEIFAGEGTTRNTGSEIAAAEGIAIVAHDPVQQDVKANTFTNNGTVSCGVFGCNGSHAQSTITQRATLVSGTGDIAINVAEGDFVNRGSTVMAHDGTLSITARNVRFETAAFELVNQSWSSSFGLTGFSASKTTANAWTVEVPIAFARAIDIRASGDITGSGAQAPPVRRRACSSRVAPSGAGPPRQGPS